MSIRITGVSRDKDDKFLFEEKPEMVGKGLCIASLGTTFGTSFELGLVHAVVLIPSSEWASLSTFVVLEDECLSMVGTHQDKTVLRIYRWLPPKRQRSKDLVVFSCTMPPLDSLLLGKMMCSDGFDKSLLHNLGGKPGFEILGIIVNVGVFDSGGSQEEGIDYEEFFAPMARIKAIRLFLAYASFMGFLVYQMDVKSAFLYGTIEEEVYVTQPPGFKDPDHPDKVYKVVKALYRLHQAPRVWFLLMTLSLAIQTRNSVTQKEDGIFISQDKYVAEILKKFNYTDVKSMIGSLMYLTASRPDIMFTCKKQTVVATLTTKAEYVAAASYCGQVHWIQNQLLDYGYNFMNTMIHIDNNSTICIIENPVQHSKTKHIEIRHHFIRDCNAKKLIQMVKIDTEHNVADLLTKGFDAGRFQYLVSSIGMLNP
ncbi:retrovirus-related pol polyprotein from transposon TNT 1-94 [Tanacetum coccineum]